MTAPRTRLTGLLVSAFVACAAALLAGTGTPPNADAAARDWYAGPCRSDESAAVTLVVDFQRLDGNDARKAETIIRCVRLTEGKRTGVQVLQDAGLRLVGAQRWSNGDEISFVCRINGRPAASEPLREGYQERCQDTPPATNHWSYWHAPRPGRSWTYSPSGGAARFVTAGGVEGWSFSWQASPSARPTPPELVRSYAPPREEPPIESSDPVTPAPVPTPTRPKPRPIISVPRQPAIAPPRSPSPRPKPSPSPRPVVPSSPAQPDPIDTSFDDDVEPEPEQTASRQATAAARWLSGELRGDGTLPGPDGETTDWGITMDALLALRAAGEDAGARRIAFALQRDAAQAARIGDEIDLGLSAKLLLTGAVAGTDGGRIGGVDARAQTLAAFEAASEPQQTFPIALAVLGLARTGEVDEEILVQLLDQQCADGGFRVDAATGNGCDADDVTSDVDATAIALQALVAAQDDSELVADRDVTRAATWLLDEQRANGSFSGGEMTDGQNANSTGLAAQALAAAADATSGRRSARYRTAQERAARWIGTLTLQDAEVAGAIAYDQNAREMLDESTTEPGIRDQLRRATTQGLLALAPEPLHELGGTPLAPELDEVAPDGNAAFVVGEQPAGTQATPNQLRAVVAGTVGGALVGLLTLRFLRRRPGGL